MSKCTICRVEKLEMAKCLVCGKEPEFNVFNDICNTPKQNTLIECGIEVSIKDGVKSTPELVRYYKMIEDHFRGICIKYPKIIRSTSINT